MNLDTITKNPAHMAIAAGAIVIAATVVSKGKQIAGVKKKTVQYGGAALVIGGLAMKFLKKGNGNGGVKILPAPVNPNMPALPPGAVPVGPTPTLPQVPGNLVNPGPTTGPAQFPGPIMSGYSRSRVSTAARKANFANQNTLGVFYNDVS